MSKKEKGLNEAIQKLREGGWFMSEPIELTKRFIELKKIPPIREGLQKYSIVHKIIMKDATLIDIRIPNEELGNEEFCGVFVYDAKDVSYTIEDGVCHFHMPADTIFTLSSRGFTEDIGYEETVTPKGRVFRHKKTAINIPEFRQAILATGLLESEEYDFYDSPDVALVLPRLKFVWPSEELEMPDGAKVIVIDNFNPEE